MELQSDQLVSIMRGIIDGMEYLHSLNIAHRDIKSQNILLKGYVPVICDFGECKVFGTEGSLMNSLHGTRYWMAPELMRGKQI